MTVDRRCFQSIWTQETIAGRVRQNQQGLGEVGRGIRQHTDPGCTDAQRPALHYQKGAKVGQSGRNHTQDAHRLHPVWILPRQQGWGRTADSGGLFKVGCQPRTWVCQVGPQFAPLSSRPKLHGRRQHIYIGQQHCGINGTWDQGLSNSICCTYPS